MCAFLFFFYIKINSIVTLYMQTEVHLNITVVKCYHCSSNSCIFLSIVYPTNVTTEGVNMYPFFGSTFYFFFKS